MNPVKAVLVSFHYSLDYCLGEWTDWTVLLFLLALIPLFWKGLAGTGFSFPCPVLAVLFGYGLASAMMTPPLFAVGNMEAGRLQALAFTAYMMILALCEGYVVGWLRKKMGPLETETGNGGFSANAAVFLMACGYFFVGGIGLTIIPSPHYYTFSSALTDLQNGNAAAYGEALAQRAALYNSGEKNILVDPLPVQPALLYFSDISTDPEDWQNKGLCRYYGLESVAVKEE